MGIMLENLKMKKAPNEARNFVVEVISWQSGEKRKRKSHCRKGSDWKGRRRQCLYY